MQKKVYSSDRRHSMLVGGEGIVICNRSGDLQSLSWPEVCSRLHGFKKGRGRSRTASPGVQFSRHITLVAKACKTGRWSTGAEISNMDVIVEKLKRKFEQLTPADHMDITENGLKNLGALAENTDDAALYDMVDEVTSIQDPEISDTIEDIDDELEFSDSGAISLPGSK